MTSPETIVGLGALQDVVAPIPARELARVQLSGDEAMALAAIGRPTPLGEFLERSWLPRDEAVALLRGLKEKGAIVFTRRKLESSVAPEAKAAAPGSGPPHSAVPWAPASVAPAATPPASVVPPKPAPLQASERPRAAASSPTASASLPTVNGASGGLSPERLQEIRALDAKLDTLDHFELLGVPRSASAADVKQAYYDASRRFHPDRFFGMELGEDRARTERIFKRVSDAHAVLSDAKRRAAYEAEHPCAQQGGSGQPGVSSSAGSSSEQRLAERRSRLLRHPYLAKTSLAHELLKAAKESLEQDDPNGAVVHLTTLLQMEPRHAEAPQLLSEAKRQLGRKRAKEQIGKGLEAERAGDVSTAQKHFHAALAHDETNATALYKLALLLSLAQDTAEEARRMARKAVEVAPSNADARVLLGSLLLDVDKQQAKGEFDEALRLDPNHAGAKKQAKKLRWAF